MGKCSWNLFEKEDLPHKKNHKKAGCPKNLKMQLVKLWENAIYTSVPIVWIFQNCCVNGKLFYQGISENGSITTEFSQKNLYLLLESGKCSWKCSTVQRSTLFPRNLLISHGNLTSFVQKTVFLQIKIYSVATTAAVGKFSSAFGPPTVWIFRSRCLQCKHCHQANRKNSRTCHCVFPKRDRSYTCWRVLGTSRCYESHDDTTFPATCCMGMKINAF